MWSRLCLHLVPYLFLFNVVEAPKADARGGDRSSGILRFTLSSEEWDTAFQKHFEFSKESPFNFGTYSKMNKAQQAVDGKSLLLALALLTAIVAAAPTANINGDGCKAALQRTLDIARKAGKNLNTSSFPDSQLCKWFARRVTIMLHHLRRLKRQPTKWKECIAKMKAEDITQLEGLVGQVQLGYIEFVKRTFPVSTHTFCMYLFCF
jgi:hypothetical protein